MTHKMDAFSMEDVLSVRSALRLRLKREALQARLTSTSASPPEKVTHGGLVAATQLEQLFQRTVQFGENQSGILLGAVGSDRRAIVLHAMRNLRSKFGDFTLVYLNGVILQNELEAFKELTAQLTRATAVKHPTLAYWNMYEYLRSLLVAKAKAGDHVIVVLDALEQFVRENSNAKQLLLYNLLDWLQAKDIKMGVLGITDNYNVVDNLEKRVRSRFSNLQIVIERPSFGQIRQHLMRMLSLDTFESNVHRELQRPTDQYAAAFSKSVKELLSEQSSFLASLEFDYDIGKPQAFFVRLTFAAVCFLDIDAPLLTAQHFRRARHLLEQDHQLAVLETVPERGIALLIGMGHLEKADQRVFTLEMVYSRWENFLRQHDFLSQLPTRSEAQKALENLLRLKLVKDAGDAFKIGRGGDNAMKQDISGSLQPEFRAVHLNFAPRTLEGMLRNGSIKCSTLLKDWAVLHCLSSGMVVGVDPSHLGELESSPRRQAGSPVNNFPILNYVHHSSDVLRKVRLGQSLDTALHSKSLSKPSTKQCQDASKPTIDVKGSMGSCVGFRREQSLDPLQGIRVREPLDSFSPLGFRNPQHKRNLLLSADVVLPLKAYKDKNSGKDKLSEDDTVSSDGPSTPSSSHGQHKAAMIIARFFRSVCRLDNSTDRAGEILRRRWREQHPEKYRRPLFELTNNQQLRVLQLYNPHLYGSQHSTSPIHSASTSIRLSRVPQMEERKRTRQLEVLARMDKEAVLLQETSRQRTQTPIGAITTLHEAYQRQPLPQERPRFALGSKRLQQTHDLVAFTKTPPNFRYKSTPQLRSIFMNQTVKSVSTLQPLTR